MGLTSLGFFLLLAAVTVSLPWLLLLLWRRAPRARWASVLLVAGVMLAQATAIGAVSVGVNRAFGFFPTWGALLGHPPAVPRLTSAPAGPVDPRVLAEPAGDQGMLRTYKVSGARSGLRQPVLAWLPPQYADPAFARTRFPVVTVLGPAYLPVTAFSGQLRFAETASAEIRAGRLAPFVAVFPEVNVQLPVDTECTDIPGGSQGYTWLARDVPSWASRALRVQAPGAGWTVTGYSTGGYCAAKLQLREPGTFAAAAAIEGYFRPELDGTTGNLAQVYAADPALLAANSPDQLLRRGSGARVLVVTSRSDPQSYAQSLRFARLARGLPGVRLFDVPAAGHSFAAVRAVLPETLRWLQQQRPA